MLNNFKNIYMPELTWLSFCRQPINTVKLYWAMKRKRKVTFGIRLRNKIQINLDPENHPYDKIQGAELSFDGVPSTPIKTALEELIAAPRKHPDETDAQFAIRCINGLAEIGVNISDIVIADHLRVKNPIDINAVSANNKEDVKVYYGGKHIVGLADYYGDQRAVGLADQEQPNET